MGQKLFGQLFLSIGAMKAGTTWLYAMLNRHPELHFTLEKELHYFYHRYVNDRHLSLERRVQSAHARYLFRFDPAGANIDKVRSNLHWVGQYLSSPVDDAWYRHLFFLNPRQKWLCDFSNLHAHVPAEAWPEISAKCEKLRVIYVMRDPVKRLWSHVKFHLEMTNSLHCLHEWGPRDFRRFVRLPHVWNNAEYGAVLRRMQSGLREEEQLVFFYEDMHADQRGTLARIEDFLGVPNIEYPQHILEKRYTESVSREMPGFFRDLVAKDIRRICSEVEAAGYKVPPSY